MSDNKSSYKSLDEKDEIYLPPCFSGAKFDSIIGYQQHYEKSIENPSQFWMDATRDLYFEKRTRIGLEYNFDVCNGPIYTSFMKGSTSNISYNCLERIIAKGNGTKTAYIFEGNEYGDSFKISYDELYTKVVNCAAVLKSKGVKAGDVVAIYLPMILELPIAMLACLRIGAIHSVIFAGFSSEAVADRIIQAEAKLLITADAFSRGPKIIQLKEIADEAVEICRKNGHNVENMLIVENSLRFKQSSSKIKWNSSIDCRWNEEMQKCAGLECPVVWVEADSPSFILYTSGSTGKPKGIVHSTIGYMTTVFNTMKYNFCPNEKDVFFCTADCGWITGHSYLVYGPLLSGLTSVFFEGIPTYPAANRLWQIIETHKVTTLYTAPTAIRTLMGYPEHLVTDHSRNSLKLIGTVGEPLNAAAWKWLYNVVGEKRCSVIDTYWQTETGGHMISAQPGITPMKPGSASLPFFGVEPILLDNEGRVIEGVGEGNLCFKAAWPGISRTVFEDHERFEKTYFKPFPGYYFTGDGAKRDKNGYFWITGRQDDLMNVSGHLLSTAEIECALSSHRDVVEAAVVACEHDIKGHVPYAYVVLRKGNQLTESTINELKVLVRHKIGAIAIPEKFQHAISLPKTRSGKVVRRMLRKIANGEEALGDTSTLLDVTVIDQLWATRLPIKIRAG